MEGERTKGLTELGQGDTPELSRCQVPIFCSIFVHQRKKENSPEINEEEGK